MIIDSLKSALITFFQGKISSLLLFILSLSITATVVEHKVLKRENAFDFLGPRESLQNPFSFLCDAWKVPTYTKDSRNQYIPYKYFFIGSSNYAKSYNKSGAWKKCSIQRNQKLSMEMKQFYENFRYDSQDNDEVNGLYWDSKGENTPITFVVDRRASVKTETCLFDSFLKKERGKTLVLTTGASGKEDFTGYDILQTLTEPVFTHKWRGSFFSKKTAAIERGMVFVLALGKLITDIMN